MSRPACFAIERFGRKWIVLGLFLAWPYLPTGDSSMIPAAGPASTGMDYSEQTLRKPYIVPIDYRNPHVRRYIFMYTTSHRPAMQAALDRMEIHRLRVLKHIKEAGLPPELLFLPLVESEYHTDAVSHAGASGLWQLMDVTARRYGLKIDEEVDERLDPEKATRAAVRLLKELHQYFGDWLLALAAYNRGIYGLEQDMKAVHASDFTLLSQQQGLPEETEQYIYKFMAIILIADNAASWGFPISVEQFQMLPVVVDRSPSRV